MRPQAAARHQEPPIRTEQVSNLSPNQVANAEVFFAFLMPLLYKSNALENHSAKELQPSKSQYPMDHSGIVKHTRELELAKA